MKKKFVIFLTLSISIILLVLWNYSVRLVPVSVLGTSVSDGNKSSRTVRCDFTAVASPVAPQFKDAVFFQKPDGAYLAFNGTAKELLSLDEDLNVLKKFSVDMNVLLVSAYKNSPGLLVNNGMWEFYSLSEETGDAELVLNNIALKYDDIPTYFDVCGDLIVYMNNKDEIIYKKDGVSGSIANGEYLICTYDENSVLTARVINEFFDLVEINKYDVTTGKSTHLRYSFNSCSNCCVSPDKKYMISFSFNRSNAHVYPKVIDLRLPRGCKLKPAIFDCCHVQWERIR